MNRQAILYLLLSSLLYGAVTVLQKDGLNKGLDPLSFALTSGIFAAIFSIFYILSKHRALGRLNKSDWQNLIVIGAIASGTYQVTIFWDQSLTSAINAGFLLKLSGLFTIPFAYFMINERISKDAWLPIIGIFFGAFLLSTNGVPKMPQIGDLIIIFAAIQLGFTNSLAKRTMRKIPAEVISSMRLIFAAVFLLIAILILQGFSSFASIYSGFWYILSSAGLTSIFVFTFYKGIELSSPSTASIFFLLSAVVSAVLAYPILGESVSFIQAIGGLVILVSAYFIGKKG